MNGCQGPPRRLRGAPPPPQRAPHRAHDRRRPVLKNAVRALAAAPAVLAMAATAVVATGGSASAAANPGPGFPAQYAAPYVETWNSPSAMASARNATGLKYFTLAFVIDGGGCNALF